MTRPFRTAAAGVGIALALLACGPAARAQHGHGAHGHTAAIGADHAPAPPPDAEQAEHVAAVTEQIRAATARYHDLEAAIGAGYRLVGPDFPGMGEHWVYAPYLLQREVSIERPAILSYLRIGGRPVLTGVAYARPVQSGETPPDFILPGLWHYHTGTVDEETLLLNPPAAHHGAGAEDQPRLAMFHAWVWTPNPAGTFAQDNWALPFLRVGLPAPAAVRPQAGKALFLASGGVAYYARLVDAAGAPDEAERAAVRAVLEQYHERLQGPLQRMHHAGAVTEQDQTELADLWTALWADIERAVSPAVWARLATLAG